MLIEKYSKVVLTNNKSHRCTLKYKLWNKCRFLFFSDKCIVNIHQILQQEKNILLNTVNTVIKIKLVNKLKFEVHKYIFKHENV